MKIAIASGKGGTGKTTLAVNLATMLSYRLPAKRCLLIDLDVEEPNAGLFFRKKPVYSQVVVREIPGWDPNRCGFCGKCTEICNFNAIARLPDQVLIFPELCHSCSACIDLCPNQALNPVKRVIGNLVHYRSETLDLIESRLEIGEPSGVPLIRKTRQYVDNKAYTEDIQIIDCPPGNSCNLMESVKGTDFVILVTEPTPFGLHDLEIAVKTLQKLSLDHGVVINKFLSESNPVSTFCIQKNLLLLGTIRYDNSLAKAISNGELLLKKFPDLHRSLESVLQRVEEHIKSTAEYS